MNPDSIVTCPYDATHFILKSKLQYHLVKCARNHPASGKIICPFDTCHIIDEVYYEKHIKNCSSSANMTRYQYCSVSRRELGTVSLDEIKNLSAPVMKDWGEDGGGTYNPRISTENRDVIRYMILATKSQKRRFKRNERKRMQSLRKVGLIDFSEDRKALKKHVRERHGTRNLVEKLNNLSLSNVGMLIDSIDLSKLYISGSGSTSSKKKCLSDIIEKVLADEFKGLMVPYL